MIVNGDCLIEMQKLYSNSIDAVVTDPPYGLKFMGKKWDYDVPSIAVWTECLRILKPGAHILSFGGTRTYHRMVVAIEDAGFEIRDQLQWIYGSGFPKSHNLDGDHEGWGTALKPANEPIVLARKPLSEKTVALNMLKWGVGAINIDVSRIATDASEQKKMLRTKGADIRGCLIGATGDFTPPPPSPLGRWPANVLFDEEAAKLLDEQSGNLKSGNLLPGHKQTGHGDKYSFRADAVIQKPYGGDSGGASRFFYCAKASKSERNKGLENNNHPTVKPVKLMEYFCRLITPHSGCVLDPFAGSGTTGVACKKLGLNFIGIEMSEEYCEIATKRLAGMDGIEPPTIALTGRRSTN